MAANWDIKIKTSSANADWTTVKFKLDDNVGADRLKFKYPDSILDISSLSGVSVASNIISVTGSGTVDNNYLVLK